jgi:2-hydroxychromene-2-carboxylate isomerase
MQKTVEFLFDFGSPYTYLAYHEVRRIAQAQDALLVWTPMLLGGVFQATGNHSPAQVPAKGAWMQGDLRRWAARFGVVFRDNPHFPINTLTLMRGAVGYQALGGRFLDYVELAFRGMWVDAENLGDPAVLAAVLARAGFAPEEFQAMVADPAVKARLKENTDAAIARGVFGAPSFIVDGQLYWGQDRLSFVEEALASA